MMLVHQRMTEKFSQTLKITFIHYVPDLYWLVHITDYWQYKAIAGSRRVFHGITF